MKVLLVHNRYQERGGEDAVVISERNLLSEHGMEVEYLEANNDAIVGLGGKLGAAGAVFYSKSGVQRVSEAIDRFRPDVVHVHNWFPTLSPGVFWASKRKHVPTLHTLHNYRLLCVNGNFFRNEAVCEDCVGTTLRTPGIVHGCYRHSRSGSAAATAGMLTHWKLGTWHRAVDRFVTLTQFARKKMITGGLPAEKIAVKPNFLDNDPGPMPGEQGYFVFVGRLSEGKGVRTLLECWRQGPDLPLLKIVGAGPLDEEVRDAAASLHNVEWLGARGGTEVLTILGNALAMVAPAIWYEAMPRVAVEALAVGTPVVATRVGAYAEMIGDAYGSLIDRSDPGLLLARLRELVASGSLASMRAAARREFDLRYSAPANFRMLEQIYEQVLPHPEMELAAEPGRP